jgi:hypothetical protein
MRGGRGGRGKGCKVKRGGEKRVRGCADERERERERERESIKNNTVRNTKTSKPTSSTASLMSR